MCAPEDSSGVADPTQGGGSRDAGGELAEALLEESRAELARIDVKASILLSASVVTMGALFAGAAELGWDPRDLGSLQWLWWAGLALVIAAIVAFGAAVWPRVEQGDSKEELAYFGHVARFKSSEELNDAIVRVASADSSGLDRTTERLFTVSKIVDAKYRCIRQGMVLLGLAALMCASAVILAWIF